MVSDFQKENLISGNPLEQRDYSQSYQSMDLHSLLIKKGDSNEGPSPEEIERQRLESERAQIQQKVEELDCQIRTFQDALIQFQDEQNKWLEKVPKEMTHMALMIAEKIIDQELHINPSIVETCCTDLLNQIQVEKGMVLHINKNDVQLLEENHSSSFEDLKSVRDLEINISPKVPRGTVHLECSTFHVYAGVPKRLEALWNKIQTEYRIDQNISDLDLADPQMGQEDQNLERTSESDDLGQDLPDHGNDGEGEDNAQ